jgi:hypothetical protein
MRDASLIRVPNALRGPESTAGRQGRRSFFAQPNAPTSCDSFGGSTWLASLSLLARCASQGGSAPTLRVTHARNRL